MDVLLVRVRFLSCFGFAHRTCFFDAVIVLCVHFTPDIWVKFARCGVKGSFGDRVVIDELLCTVLPTLSLFCAHACRCDTVRRILTTLGRRILDIGTLNADVADFQTSEAPFTQSEHSSVWYRHSFRDSNINRRIDHDVVL